MMLANPTIILTVLCCCLLLGNQAVVEGFFFPFSSRTLSWGQQGPLASSRRYRRHHDDAPPTPYFGLGIRRPLSSLVLSSSSSSSPRSSSSSVEQEIAELERQILASAKAKMDYNQITKALDANNNNNDPITSRNRRYEPLASTQTWKVALTAAGVTATSALLVFHNLYVAAFCGTSIFVVANSDPLHDDSILGALSRIVGRATLQSYETSQPKLKAVARAVVTGQDEVQQLQQQLHQLRQERQEMKEWRKLVYGKEPNDNNNSASSRSSSSMSARKKTVEQEIAEIERKIQASVQQQMDYNQVTRKLQLVDDHNYNDSFSMAAASSSAQQHAWQVALTAATVAAGGSLVLFTNLYVSLFVWVTIFIVANADPLQDDSLLGALARVLGRATLDSYETSKPKMQALARAVVTGQDEVRELRQSLQELQIRTDELALWKQRRLWVEDNLAYYSLEDLKQQARIHRLPVSGTKIQLLQRLVDAEIIDIYQQRR